MESEPDALAYRNMGDALRAKGMRREADEAYKKAGVLTPRRVREPWRY